MIKRRRVHTDMKEVEVFIGPCSKFITGQGWVTEVPIEQLKAKGYIKNDSLTKEIERLTERETFLENAWKTSLESTQTVEIALKANRAREEELQKQVDELKERAKIDLENEKNWGKIQTKQAVKDTAKEILQKIMNIIKKSDGFLAEEVVRIMAKQNGVEVE